MTWLQDGTSRTHMDTFGGTSLMVTWRIKSKLTREMYFLSIRIEFNLCLKQTGSLSCSLLPKDQLHQHLHAMKAAAAVSVIQSNSASYTQKKRQPGWAPLCAPRCLWQLTISILTHLVFTCQSYRAGLWADRAWTESTTLAWARFQNLLSGLAVYSIQTEMDPHKYLERSS